MLAAWPALLFFFSATPVYAMAGTLTCNVATSCLFGVPTVLRMSATSNGHAELASQANYAQRVCCYGVTGLSTTCSGTYATMLKLSGVTNAHVQENTYGTYANSACLSVPSNGAVVVAYQDNNCNGYDATLASISASTNAQIGNPSAYTRKICATAFNGTLSADIVDAAGTTVASPAVTLTTAVTSYSCGSATGTLGTSTEMIRVWNLTSTPQWTLTIAASAGPTASWSSGGSTYDFNDAACSDGADADSVAGRLTVDPSVATVAASTTCTTTGVSKGASASFAEGTLNSLTLMSASASAGIGCKWDMTGAAITQDIPAEQAVGTYNLNLTLSIVAS